MKNTLKGTKKSGKLTLELQNRLAAHLQSGCSIEAATAIAGISRTSFYTWMRRGRRELDRLEAGSSAAPDAEERLYADFWQAVDQAVGALEARNVRIIEEAAKGGGELIETITVLDASGEPARKTAKVKIAKPEWQAAKWLLERRFPGRWGKPRLETRQDQEAGPEPDANEPDLSQLSTEELITLETLVEKTTRTTEHPQGNG